MSFAQDTLLVFDRPGIAESPYISAEKSMQFELGTSFMEKTGIESFLFPSLMVRKYIGVQSEIRMTLNYTPQMMTIILGNERLNYDPIAFGIKRKLWKESRWIPEAAVLVNVFTPIQQLGHLFLIKNVNWELNFLFQQSLNKRFSVNYNFGYLTSEFSKDVVSTSFCLNFNLMDKIGFFAEVFTYNPIKDQGELGVDLGCTYSLGKYSQIDLSFINNNYKLNDYISCSIGYAYKFKR